MIILSPFLLRLNGVRNAGVAVVFVLERANARGNLRRLRGARRGNGAEAQGYALHEAKFAGLRNDQGSRRGFRRSVTTVRLERKENLRAQGTARGCLDKHTTSIVVA